MSRHLWGSGSSHLHSCVLCLVWGTKRPGKAARMLGWKIKPHGGQCPAPSSSCTVPRPTPLQLSPGPPSLPFSSSSSPPCSSVPAALLPEAQRHGLWCVTPVFPPSPRPPLCLHLPHCSPEGASRDVQNVPRPLTCLCLGLSWAFCLELPSLFHGYFLSDHVSSGPNEEHFT